MTDYLDTPARSLAEVRAEVAAEVAAQLEAARTLTAAGAPNFLHAFNCWCNAERLKDRLAQIDAEIKARETKP